MEEINDRRRKLSPRRLPRDEPLYPTSAGLARLMAALVSGTDRDPTTFVTRCGWCQRFEIAGEWLDLDAAASSLTFDADGLPPTITHGICEPCVAAFSRALDEV